MQEPALAASSVGVPFTASVPTQNHPVRAQSLRAVCTKQPAGALGSAHVRPPILLPQQSPFALLYQRAHGRCPTHEMEQTSKTNLEQSCPASARCKRMHLWLSALNTLLKFSQAATLASSTHFGKTICTDMAARCDYGRFAAGSKAPQSAAECCILRCGACCTCGALDLD